MQTEDNGDDAGGVGLRNIGVLDFLTEMDAYEHQPQDASLGRLLDLSAFAHGDVCVEWSRDDVPQTLHDFPTFICDVVATMSTRVSKDAMQMVRVGNRIAMLERMRGTPARDEELPEECKARLRACASPPAWLDAVFECLDDAVEDEMAPYWLRHALQTCPFQPMSIDDFCDAWAIRGHFNVIVHTTQPVAVLLQKVVDAYKFETVLQFEHYMCAMRQRPITVADQTALQETAASFVATQPILQRRKTTHPRRAVLHAMRSRKRWTAEFRNAISHNHHLAVKVQKLERSLVQLLSERGAVAELSAPAEASEAGLGALAAGLGASAAGLGASAAGLGASAASLGASAAGLGASAAGLGASAAGLGASAAGLGASAAGLGASAAGLGASAVGLDASAVGLDASAAGLGLAVDMGVLNAGLETVEDDGFNDSCVA